MALVFGSQEALAQQELDQAVFAVREQLLGKYGSQRAFLEAIAWAEAVEESEASLLNDINGSEDPSEEEAKLQERDVADARQTLADLQAARRAARW